MLEWDEQKWERWRQRWEAQDLKRAIAKGTAKTCAMCGLVITPRHAKTRYRSVPWHGMLPTDEVLCVSCWFAEKEASPLNSEAAKAALAASRARAYAARQAEEQAETQRMMAQLAEQWEQFAR